MLSQSDVCKIAWILSEHELNLSRGTAKKARIYCRLCVQCEEVKFAVTNTDAALRIESIELFAHSPCIYWRQCCWPDLRHVTLCSRKFQQRNAFIFCNPAIKKPTCCGWGLLSDRGFVSTNSSASSIDDVTTAATSSRIWLYLLTTSIITCQFLPCWPETHRVLLPVIVRGPLHTYRVIRDNFPSSVHACNIFQCLHMLKIEAAYFIVSRFDSEVTLFETPPV